MKQSLSSKLTAATGHWLFQRITAVVLIPLSFHLLTFLQLCFKATYEETLAWLASPLNTFGLLAWLLLTFYHAALGLQVVIEDYIGNRQMQHLLIKAINFSFSALAILSAVLIFNIG